jgi:alpha-L-fucosidase
MLIRRPTISLFNGALVTALAAGSVLSLSQSAPAETALGKPPAIVKKGTIGLDLVETTPFVFKDKLYRLEWFRNGSVLRIMDHDSGAELSRFGPKHRFPCAFVEGDTVYVFGTKETHGWTGDTLTLFRSKDLKNWDEQLIFKHPQGKTFCNTSVCKADGRYVMSYEQNENGFHAQFLESTDLLHWTMLPEDRKHDHSPHCLRWNRGWFYLFSLEADKPHGYEQHVARSHDLIQWESSPLNPVLAASPEDRTVLNQKLTEAERTKVAKATDINNSDIDFCEYHDRLVINYSWGNQQGVEFLAEAEFDGTLEQFLRGWFPE